MPPVRTVTAIKPMKTERTHEENQERAYIAASRRSDRSLEARVESARRASEIHKRRTGRSLRVTEQDVINEEMYEEEDDDLPMQYRRLTAHLYSANVDFSNRLKAHIAGQAGMRDAFGAALYGHTPNGQFMNPSMMQMPSPQANFSHFMMPPQQSQMLAPSPGACHSPYPMPHTGMQQGSRLDQHNRSPSATAPQEPPTYQQQQQRSPSQGDSGTHELGKQEDRPMSLPLQNMTPQTSQSQYAFGQSPVMSRAGSNSSATTPLGFTQHPSPQQQKRAPTSPHQAYQYSSVNPRFNQQQDCSPLSLSLPLETQQILHPNPAMAMASPQDMKTQRPTYSYNPNGKPRHSPTSTRSSLTSSSGLNATLAPTPLDTNLIAHAFMQASPASAVTDNLATPSDMQDFGMSFHDHDFLAFKSDASNHNFSGQTTPFNDDMFNNFTNDEYFDTAFLDSAPAIVP
ncbi:hypothetical protein Tdes44962_MAKER09296 [Teratosphaeria destructans]|uniref:Uncharacterized protein n=1 Tax=Teratosphaeria destructans TaxID=418781 RepID=A0A9W7STQ8_9PEZI|nr:hypothetical protein Tdes44962_MAKER09296 [Teratosphaeria destructans]